MPRDDDDEEEADSSSEGYSFGEERVTRGERGQRPCHKAGQGKALQTVPPNTPFNSLSATQVTQMMTVMGIEGSSGTRGSPTSLRQAQRQARSVRCFFDRGKEGVLDAKDDRQDGKEVAGDYIEKKGRARSRSMSSGYSNNGDGRYRCEGSVLTTKAPPNSPLKTIGINNQERSRAFQSETASSAGKVEADSDRQSKLKEIQWQLRFPHAHQE